MITSLIHILRLARAGFVLAHEGVFANVDPGMVPASMRLPLMLSRLIARRDVKGGVNRLAAAIERLGPSYVKLGQFLATRPDVVGPQVVRDLEMLQDRMAPFGRDIAVRTIEASFDRKLEEIFVELSEPVAAASIAQVHKAKVRDKHGERDVAVKILRPGVERRFARDLSDMYFAARFAERHFAEARRLRMV